MTTLVRWDPFGGLRAGSLAEFAGLSRALNHSFYPFSGRTRQYDLTFPVDLSETEGEVVVKAVLPGVKGEEIDISVNDGILTVKGETKSETQADGESYYRREIRYGVFSRSIPLPAAVDHEKADAEFVDGVLTITLPKAEAARPKQIKIKATLNEIEAEPQAATAN